MPVNSKFNHEAVLNALYNHLLLDQQWHVRELAAMLHCNRRSIYKYLTELEKEGIRINRNNGHPRLYYISFGLDDSVSASLEPADYDLCRRYLETLSPAADASKDRQCRALSELRSLLTPYFNLISTNNVACVRAINTAINHRVQIVIHNYQSGHSGSVADRRVEPVGWSPNGRQLCAFDVDKLQMRTFVPSRMGPVTVTRTPWQHSHEHRMVEYDCFWMSGTPFTVVLRMNLRALNLLHEEYELSTSVPVADVAHLDPLHPFELSLQCRSPYGVGRFVRGLPDDVVVVQGLDSPLG